MSIIKHPSNRRAFLGTTLATSVSAFATPQLLAADGIKIEVTEQKVISLQKEKYHGWPTLAQRKNGQLLLVCSGGRETHVCPFGRVELMRSNDGGATWSYSQVIMDTPIDDRDAGILETSEGTLLATTFTSLAYEPILVKANETQDWDAARMARWNGVHNQLNETQRNNLLGNWMLRSGNGGKTWSRPYRCWVHSPHGPIELKDGTLFYAGKQLWTEEPKIGAAVSTDDGRTWKMHSTISARDGDDYRKYHELHAVETKSGKIIAHIRNHNSKSAGETLQCESTDGGRTWSPVHSIGVWGFPSHLLQLDDGRLLMSYGYRNTPFGNQVRISEDEGETWSAPITLSDDAVGYDLGYPSTIQRSDGMFVTVWYEKLASSEFAQLRQATWKLL